MTGALAALAVAGMWLAASTVLGLLVGRVLGERDRRG